jgi:hypothetical protein
MMVIIVWNPPEFYRIVAPPKGMKFNADYYITHIVDPLAEWRLSQVGGSDRRLHVHADNARPHTAKKVIEFFAGNAEKELRTRRIHDATYHWVPIIIFRQWFAGWFLGPAVILCSKHSILCIVAK